MTWAEFKRMAEARGVKDEDVIRYIDVSWDDDDFWTVMLHDDGSVSIY